MKIDLKTLTEKIEQTDYLQDMETVKYADVSHKKAKLKELSEKMVKEAATALNHNSLLQTQLVVEGMRPVTFSLELNIINLPYANYKKISNFVEEDQEYELNLYFETSSEYVNASHFRIDQLATGAEVLADPAQVSAKLADSMAEKFTEIFDNAKAAKAAEKAKKAAKKTKSTTKKSTKKTTKRASKK